MARSLSRWDYVGSGYGREWLTKSDLKPGVLKSFDIDASMKDIETKYARAHDGWIVTGGNGHKKHVKKYSISKLKDIFRK